MDWLLSPTTYMVELVPTKQSGADGCTFEVISLQIECSSLALCLIISKMIRNQTYEGHAWCSGETCLTESQGHGFEIVSQHLWRKGLSRFISRPQSCEHVGASGPLFRI
jgi:hypothetical protein